jgi:ABC-2 type transport system ATP-binding protein
LLQIQHLSRSYRGIPAISDISFTVRPGEIVGFLGPNGAGKSTTVKIITGLLRPNDGRVLFEGKDIHADLVAWRAQLGDIPEEAHLYTWMSAMEYLQLVGRLRGIRERQIQQKAEAMLELLGLASWRFSPMSLYSKGMRQRVLLVAALLHDPRMLVFDEPLSGLDVLSARLFRDLLQELAAAGKSVLYISHVLEIVEQLCDRVIVIAQGKLIADAPPAELTTLMQLPTLEKVFAQLVQQQDTLAAARAMFDVMKAKSA